MSQNSEHVFQDGVLSDLELMNFKNSMLSYGRNLSFVTGEKNNFVLSAIKGLENINNIKLTDGFMPMGGCEYLGIAYIFSFNPTTSVCEIGSIPSPNYAAGASGAMTNDYRPFNNLYPTLAPTTKSPLSTPLFDWDLEHPIQVEPRIEYDGSVNLYFIDNKNMDRVVNSGFIKNHETFTLGVKSLYVEKFITDQTSLIPRSSKILEVDLAGVENDGALLPGNYIYYFFYLTQGGNQTDMIGQSFIVSVFDGEPVMAQMCGGKIDSSNNVFVTNKKVHLQLKNLDTTFKFFSVYYERIDGEDEQSRSYFKLVNKYPITDADMDFYHTGTEKQFDVSRADINIRFGNIGASQSVAQVDNKLYIANTVASDSIDSTYFEQFAALIKLEWFDKSMDILGTQDLDEIFSQSISARDGGYHNPMNIYYDLGYWGGEAYDVGIVFKLQSGETLAFPCAGFDYYNGDATPVSTVALNGKQTGIIRFPVRNSNAVPDMLSNGSVSIFGMKANFEYALVDAAWDHVRNESIGFYFVRSVRNKQAIAQGYMLRSYRFLGINETFGGNGWANWVKDKAVSTDMKSYRSSGTNADQVLFDNSVNKWRTVNFPLLFPSVEFTGAITTDTHNCGSMAKKADVLGVVNNANDLSLGDDIWNWTPQYIVDNGDNPAVCGRSFVLTETYSSYGLPGTSTDYNSGLYLVDSLKKRRYMLEVDNLNYGFFSNDWGTNREYLLNLLNEKAVYVSPIAHVSCKRITKDNGLSNTSIDIVWHLDGSGVPIDVYIPDGNAGAPVTIAIAGFGGVLTEAGYGNYYVLTAASGTSPSLAGKRFYLSGDVSDGDLNNSATTTYYPIAVSSSTSKPAKIFLTDKVYKSNATVSKAAPRYEFSSVDPEKFYEGMSYGILEKTNYPHPQTGHASLVEAQHFNYGRRSFTSDSMNRYQDYYALVDELNTDGFIGFNFGTLPTNPDSAKLVTGNEDVNLNKELSTDPWNITQKVNLENNSIPEDPATNVNKNYMYSDINKLTALVNVYEKERYVPFIGRGSSPTQVLNKAKLLSLYNFATELQWVQISKTIYWDHDDDLYPDAAGTNTIWEKATSDHTDYGFSETYMDGTISKYCSIGLFNGDCFLSVGFNRNYYSTYNRATDNGQKYVDVGRVFSIVAENNHNPAFRKDFIIDLTEENYQLSESASTFGMKKADRTFYPYYAGVLNHRSEWWMYIDRYKLPESTNYLKGYSVTGSSKDIIPFDPNTPIVRQRFWTRIWFSQRQNFSDTVDYYREFLPLDFQDFDIKNGAIIDIVSFQGQLFMIQESAISLLNHNDRIQVAGDGSGPIFASSVGRLSQYVQTLADEVGSQHTFSIVKGKTGFFGVDARKNLMWGVSNGQFEPLSYLKNSSILYGNIATYRTNPTEIGRIDIRAGVNKVNGDIYFTFYNQRTDVQTGEDFTFGYNELLKVFLGNMDFVPAMYFNIGNDLYCFQPLRSAGVYVASVHIYKHNSNVIGACNFFGTQFGMEFEVVLSQDGDWQKVLDNLEIISNNLYPDKIQYGIENASHLQEVVNDDVELILSNARYREDKVLIQCGEIDTINSGTADNTVSVVGVDSRIRSKYIKVRFKYALNGAKSNNTDISKGVRVRSVNLIYRISKS